MHVMTLALLVPLMLGLASCRHMSPEAAGDAKPAAAVPAVDFTAHVKPILEARCQPCHFTGGVMYERLPFDRPETIHTLGTKLFTRIKDSSEQELIRRFLAQPLPH